MTTRNEHPLAWVAFLVERLSPPCAEHSADPEAFAAGVAAGERAAARYLSQKGEQ